MSACACVPACIAAQAYLELLLIAVPMACLVCGNHSASLEADLSVWCLHLLRHVVHTEVTLESCFPSSSAFAQVTSALKQTVASPFTEAGICS